MSDKINSFNEPSPAYRDLCAEINANPDILSGLYDLDLLPEQVNDEITKSSQMLMMAFFFGYKHAINNALTGVDGNES